MDAPDWYPDWRDDAFRELQEKNAQLEAEFRLGHWGKYHYDLDAGAITFSEEGRPRVVADIQVVGSIRNDWLWAWANAQFPLNLIAASQQARAFGEEHRICDLTHAYVEDDDMDALGWELTAVTARISKARGAYRPAFEGGGAVFFVLTEVVLAS